MEIIIGIAVIGALAVMIAVQVAARQQLDINVPKPRAESAQVIEKYFGPIWTRVSGPGTYNFKPKLRMHAPTISIKLHGSDTTSQVSVWTSDYKTIYGGMYHAGLMWRKKRGVAKRLLASSGLAEPRLNA